MTGRTPLIFALLAIVVGTATPARLSAQTFPAPGSMDNFSNVMIEAPNTAMVIEASDPVSSGDNNTTGPPATGESTPPPGRVPLGTPNVGAGNYDGPIGVSGIFNGNVTTAGSYDPLSQSAHRAIDDIVVPGSVGKYPLKMTRYYNSRSYYGSGWSHEYSWGTSLSCTRVFYPNGNIHDASCGPVEGVSDSWEGAFANGTGTWRLADGGNVHFTGGSPDYIYDPSGLTTTITYDQSLMISRVTEPGGRYLKFNYGTHDGVRVLDNVEAYDGPQNNLIERVRYSYTWQLTGGTIIQRVMMLTGVTYDDGTTATYTYRTDNVPNDPLGRIVKDTPLLATCDDKRYNGPMRQIAYEYYNGGPHGVIHKERYSDIGSAVSTIEPGVPLYLHAGNYPMPTDFTETRGDQQQRTFHYTQLHFHRCAPGDNCTPCDAIVGDPQHQMLLNYTDFKGNTTILSYDPNTWYITSVTDANQNMTAYERGNPPPAGIGEVKKIIHPDQSYIQYIYYTETEPNAIQGHYIQSIRDENNHVTAITRDGNYRITRIGYPSDASTPPSYEEFLQYNSFGQFTVHHMRNDAYERFAYTRGLLTDKWNPQSSIPLNGDPHTHYDYYTATDGKPGWIDRVKTVTMPANWPRSYQATETYEYDKDANNLPCAGRGLITKITHADGHFQSFSYNQWGNKIHEWDELGERTDYRYDNYSRVLTATRVMTSTPNEVTTYTYNPTNGNGTNPYLHTTSNPDTITSPTNILTSNVYDQNFRKTSTTVAGRTSWFHYDAVGNQDCVTDPRGTGPCSGTYTTKTEYDTRNRKWHVWNGWGAQNYETIFTYDNASNLIRSDHPDGSWEQKSYDAVNRVLTDSVLKSTSPSQVILTTWFTYNPSGTLSKVTDARGSGPGDPNYTTTFGYNASDQRTSMTYPDGSFRTSAYDDAHNMKWRTTVGGSALYFAYDQRNRKYAELWFDHPTNAWSEWRYFGLDSVGRLRRATNGTGNWNTNIIADVTRAYDTAGRLTLDRQAILDQPNGPGLPSKDVSYEYDITVRGTDGKPTRMYASGAGYDYDFRYDDMGRFDRIFVHGAGNPAFQYYHDDASNLTQRHNQFNGVDQFYNPDNLDRVGRVDLQKNGSFAHEAYQYDSMNRLQTVTREDNKQDQFGYYRDGELYWVLYGVSPTPTPTPPGSPTPTPTPAGTVATPTFAPGGGNIYPYYTISVAISTTTAGAQIRYTLDGTNWTVIANGASVTFTPGIGKTLTAVGFKSGMADSAPHSEDYYRDSGQTPGTKDKTVDDLLSMPGGMNTQNLDTANRSVTYAYDKAGNRTEVEDTGVNGNTLYTPNNINQYINTIGGYTITNGPEHEIASYGTVNYTYSEDEHLTRVTSGTSIYNIAYDALGRCVRRTVHTDQDGDLIKYYIYDGERPILEYKSTGSMAASNVYGKGIDEILMRTDYTFNPPITFYYQQNHEGSVTHLTDGNGNVIEKYRYDVYGSPTIYPPQPGATPRPVSLYSNRFMFTGREYSAMFSFYEYRARTYHPGLGRFMSEDPKLFDAGDYNLFRYCHNDPIDFTDPMGLDGPPDNPAISHPAGAKAQDQQASRHNLARARAYAKANLWHGGAILIGSLNDAINQLLRAGSNSNEGTQGNGASQGERAQAGPFPHPATREEYLAQVRAIEGGDPALQAPAFNPLDLLGLGVAKLTASGGSNLIISTSSHALRHVPESLRGKVAEAISRDIAQRGAPTIGRDVQRVIDVGGRQIGYRAHGLSGGRTQISSAVEGAFGRDISIPSNP